MLTCGAALQPIVIASKGRQRQDGRVLLLFDINGVLMEHRFDGRSHHHDLRPGVHHLLRLRGRFRLGVYSSATRGTVQRALTKLHGNLANAAAQAEARVLREAEAPREPGQPEPAAAQEQHQQQAAEAREEERQEGAQHGEAQQVQQAQQAAAAALALPQPLFEVVLCREHCRPADPESIAARPDGRPWDTVKPLGAYFADLSRVALIDDSPHKSLAEEAANMVVMPK